MIRITLGTSGLPIHHETDYLYNHRPLYIESLFVMGLRGPGAKPVKTATRKRRPAWEKRGLSRADRVIAFVESLKITSGSLAGEKMRLRDWQRDIVHGLYGTDDEGNRITRQGLITLPRKQGKTQLAAALALAHLVGPEVEQRGQIYSAAADRDQAALLYKEMKAMLQEAPQLLERVIIRDFNKMIEDTDSGSIYQALSSDARKAHGLNASFVVCDELAQWRGRDLYDNLLTSMGARAEPLMVTISTQSADPHHIMSELVHYGERVLSGEAEDPAFYACIYRAPEDADVWDEQVWYDCNPALGDFRSLEEMRAFANRAKKIPAAEASFKNLYLNQQIDAETRFLNPSEWLAGKDDIDLNDLKGRKCWGGLDLSSTTDLTSLVLVFPIGPHLKTLCFFWVPGDRLREREDKDRVPYTVWRDQGEIIATPGKTVDKNFVVHTLGQVAAEYDIQSIAFDRWRIEDLIKQLGDEGIELNLIPYGQGFKDMGPAVDHLETSILDEVLCHDSPVLDWCASNAVVVQDPAGNRKLDKGKSYARIDGIIALAMALGIYYREPPVEESVYSERGLLVLSA